VSASAAAPGAVLDPSPIQAQIAAPPLLPAQGPWSLAWAKLRRDRASIIALAVLLTLVLACLAAPIYASDVSHTDPFLSNIDGVIYGTHTEVMPQSTEGIGLGVTPIGPSWRPAYFLGADDQGRDVMARLLYGGRASLLIAGSATIICLIFAGMIGIVAGFFGGWIDAVLSRILDVLWAFPIYLLAISLSIVLINSTLTVGPFVLDSSSLLLPILIIGIVYVPYVARPVRGQVLSLTRSDFVLAARALGVPRHRILLRDILPNITTTLIVFAPLMMALNLLTESALSFLSIGVQAPTASWGTIIQDGESLIYTRPMVAIAPGLAIVITVLALNILGDGVRDALDPKAKMRAD
jgi:peptide/nickel transport system permease protein